MSMTSRERVLMAFNHQEPDRVPPDMMGNATMLLDQTYLRLRDYLGLSPIPPIRSGTSANYYDERILEYLGMTFAGSLSQRVPRSRPSLWYFKKGCSFLRPFIGASGRV